MLLMIYFQLEDLIKMKTCLIQYEINNIISFVTILKRNKFLKYFLMLKKLFSKNLID